MTCFKISESFQHMPFLKFLQGEIFSMSECPISEQQRLLNPLRICDKFIQSVFVEYEDHTISLRRRDEQSPPDLMELII